MLRPLYLLLLGALSLSMVAGSSAVVAAETGSRHSNPQSIEEGFEKAARAFSGLPIERMAQSDTAYPKDAEEFRAMDGFGMMEVSLIAQDKSELPPRRIYAVVGGKQVELRLVVGSFATSSGSALVQKTIGPYRWNGLYCYPVYLSAEASQLLVDFAKHSDGFSLGVPGNLPAYLKGPIHHPHGLEPPTQAALVLLKREYPGLFVYADQP